MKRITKAERANREWAAEELQRRLVAIGAVVTPGTYHPITLQTPIGPLGITIAITESQHFCAPNLPSVFCRWDNPELASRVIPNGDMNTYSGKWNHHYDRFAFRSKDAARMLVDRFMGELVVALDRSMDLFRRTMREAGELQVVA